MPQPARAPDIELYPLMVPLSFHVNVKAEGEVLDLTNSDVTAPIFDDGEQLADLEVEKVDAANGRVKLTITEEVYDAMGRYGRGVSTRAERSDTRSASNAGQAPVTDLFLTSFGAPDLVVDVVGEEATVLVIAPRGERASRATPVPRATAARRARRETRAIPAQRDRRVTKVMRGRRDRRGRLVLRVFKVHAAFRACRVKPGRKDLKAPKAFRARAGRRVVIRARTAAR